MPTTSWCCAKARKTQRARGCEIRAWVKDNGLRLHTDKTHIGDCRKRGEGFEFLGYRFEPGGRYVRKKSLNRLKDSIRAKTRRSCGQSLARVIESLNRTLQGWFNYFKHAHHRPRPVHSTGVACNPAQAGEAARLRQ